MKSPVTICSNSLERVLEVRWIERGRRVVIALSQTSGLAWEVGRESTRWSPSPKEQPLATSLFLSHTQTHTHMNTFLHTAQQGQFALVYSAACQKQWLSLSLWHDGCHSGTSCPMNPMVLNPSQHCWRGVSNMHASCGKRQTLQWSRKCVCFLYSDNVVKKCP